MPIRLLLGVAALLVCVPDPSHGASRQDACESTGRRTTDGGGRLRLLACGADLPPDSVRAFLDRRAAVYERVADFLGTPPDDRPEITYRIYDRLEEMAARTERMAGAIADHETGTVHLVREPGIRGERLNREAELLIRAHLGRPAVPVLETGLWMQFVRRWHGHRPLYWTGWMHRGGLRTPSDELLRTERRPPESESYLFRRAMAAGLVDLLLREAGRARFLREYASWKPTESEYARMRSWWTPYLDSLAIAHETEYRRRRERSVENPFLEGFNFAHEGFGRHGGYASERADSSLARLAAMGAGAISVLPYSHVPGLRETAPIDVERSARGENDAALRHVFRRARDLEMQILLKPHLWTREGWIGDLAMDDAAEWDRFFAHYEDWILHYALLAEMEEVPIFSVGVELEEATIGHPDRWRAVIERIRGIYAGELVYAANWGREFEQIAFWDALDYMGVDWYYPLAETDEPSPRLLRERAEEIADRVGELARETGRPVLLTEVGFPALEGAWRRPHDGRREVTLSLEDQELGYRVLHAALADEEWLAGLFWWKWPSDLRRGGPDHRGFTPNGKPAADVVRDWFGGPMASEVSTSEPGAGSK